MNIFNSVVLGLPNPTYFPSLFRQCNFISVIKMLVNLQPIVETTSIFGFSAVDLVASALKWLNLGVCAYVYCLFSADLSLLYKHFVV